jgi:hypothetical protein
MSAATVQQPHQDGAEHSRNAYAFDRPESAYLSCVSGQGSTHQNCPCCLHTAEVAGSNPASPTLGSSSFSCKRRGIAHSAATHRYVLVPNGTHPHLIHNI